MLTKVQQKQHAKCIGFLMKPTTVVYWSLGKRYDQNFVHLTIPLHIRILISNEVAI